MAASRLLKDQHLEMDGTGETRETERERRPHVFHKLPLSHIHPAKSVGNNSSFVCQLAFKAVGMSLLDLSGKLVKLHRVSQGEGGWGKD
jgi:hypothetical protein